jgi:hypothetical protein
MPTSTFANAVGAAMEVPITKAAVARIRFSFIYPSIAFTASNSGSKP